MYTPLKARTYASLMMPLIRVSERALIKLCAWMDKNGVDDFSEAILILLGERPETGVKIIPGSRVIQVDYEQARKEPLNLEVE